MDQLSRYRDPVEFTESLTGLTIETMPNFCGLAYRSDERYVEEWHYHDVGQLLYAVSGTMRVYTSNRIVLLPPTMALWIPPGVQHRVEVLAAVEMRIIFARPDALPIVGENSCVLAVSPLLRELILAIISRPKTSASDPQHDSLYTLFSSELSQSREIPLSLPMPTDHRIKPMIEKATTNLGGIVSVTKWCSLAPTSRKTIERIFIRQTGLTPSQWLKQARLIFAVSAIANGNSVGSVALDLGYATASSFSYMFKQSLGVSPSKFSN